MEAVGYLRVSSKAQNAATQKAAITRAATARGDTISEWYSEKVSAKTMKRPELELLQGDAMAGKFRRLYVFKYDRLCRTGIRDLLNVLELFRTYGCEAVAVADVVDLAGPAAEMILAALAFAARLERQAINERISAARERVEAEGGTWGRPKRSVDVATARKLQEEGRSIRAISIALKCPRATLARALANQLAENNESRQQLIKRARTLSQP